MKHVLITGGSDDLDKISAQKLMVAGHDVTILPGDEARTRAAAEELSCKYVVADVSDAKQVEAAIQQAGEVDTLINNAGNWMTGLLEANTPDEAEKVIASNTLGTIYFTQAVIPAMK